MNPYNLKRTCSNLDFELNDEQFEAVKKIVDFFVKSGKGKGNRSKFIRLAGFAGTGKTAIISYLTSKEVLSVYKRSNRKIGIGAPTWKAALVLRSKGVLDASSIHHFLYKGVEEKIEGDSEKQTRLSFQLRTAQEMQATFEFFIFDEVSMVSKSLRDDIEQFGIPILYVGDPFQLPPVSDNEKIQFLEGSELFLRTISRQALESPIIKLSMEIREGLNYDEHIYQFNNDVIDMFDKREYQIITGFNNTRKHINNYVRARLGYNNDNMPALGEKLIGRSNLKELGLFNGQDWVVRNDNSNKPLNRCTDYPVLASTSFCEGDVRSLKTLFPYEYMNCPDNMKPYIDIKDNRARFKMLNDDLIYQVDFAYAITCHVSQGSAFDNVIVVAQRFPNATDLDYRRWLYTAVTRAVENVVIINGYNEHLVNMRM